MTPAETRSIDATKASTATGTTVGEHELRQVAGERRLERVDAATAAVATSALSAPSSAAGRSRSRRSTSSSRSCESTAAAARRPATSNAHAGAGARDHDRGEERERHGDVVERRAVEAPGGDVGEQRRLRKHEQRGDDAERRVRREQARPPRARRIRRGSTTLTGLAAFFRATSSTGSPASSPPSRARNTWYVHAWYSTITGREQPRRQSSP